MQWLEFRKISLKAENIPCVSNPSSSRSVGDADRMGTGDLQSWKIESKAGRDESPEEEQW